MSVPSVEALHAVKAGILQAERESGRSEGSVTLVAVSKTYEGEAIRPVLEAGQRVFGENRVQEAMGKWPALRADHAGTELHLIGPLQSNKAKEAVGFFDVVHSLDREKLARALADEVQRQGRAPRFFIQVNTGREPQKAGCLPEETDGFVARCRDVYGLPVMGLMCIPPVEEPASLHFQLLAQLGARNGLHGLSMGMSDDYSLAVALGATHVRVGSAIFGARPKA